MQSIRLSKEIIYSIPDKVRWDAWWLIPAGFPPPYPRHASACGWRGAWHPRLSCDSAAVRPEPTVRTP